MDYPRSRTRPFIAPALAVSFFGISTLAFADGGRLVPNNNPPESEREGSVIALQLGPGNTRFLPRVGGPMTPVGMPLSGGNAITWSYAVTVAASTHISPIPGIMAPADPDAPTFYQAMVPEQSVLIETLDGAYERGEWLEIIARCFDRWESICGITFQFVSDTGGATPTPPPGSDPNDYDPWDAGDRWETIPDDDAAGFYAPQMNYNWLGDPANPVQPNTAVGDIRIAARTIDGRSAPDGVSGSAFYYVYPFDAAAGTGAGEGNGEMGNIILDSEEIWNDPFAPNILEVVMMRAIGEAIGVSYKCPRWEFPGGDPLLQAQLMELQEGDFVNESGFLTRPFPPLRILEPQQDDIRTAQQLYGDPTDGNDSFTSGTTINFLPNFNNEQLTFQFISPDTGLPVSSLTNRALVTLDLGAGDVDLDFYELIIPQLLPDGSLTIRVSPSGSDYYSVGFTTDANGVTACDKTAADLDPGDIINALELDDLRFTLATLDEVNSLLYDAINPDNPDSPWFLPFEGAPTPADLLTYVDNNSFGVAEEFTLPVEPGRYFLIVRGRDDFQGDQAVQRYDITFLLEQVVAPASTSFRSTINGDLANNVPGTGRLALTQNADNGGPFLGDTARVAIISGGLAFTGHTVFDNLNAIETAWDGPNPSTTTRTNEATRTLAAMAGREIDTEQFIGMAAPSEVVSSSVAIQGQSPLTPNFTASLQAIYYSLFGLARPEYYEPLGMTGPPTLYLNLFNTPYIDIAGDSLIARAYDAAATMLDVPIIFSAGEFGLIDADEDCTGGAASELAPGAQRIGSRSLSAPATSYNGITVTAVGGTTNNPTPQYQFPYYVLPSAQSSKGPIDSANTANARSGIDIAAPGWQAVTDTRVPLAGGEPDPCQWFGHAPTGLLNLPMLTNGPTPDPNAFGLIGGSNIAAAITAGAVAMLQDAGNKFVDDQFPEGGVSTSPLVLKSILLNSSVLLPGWSNTGTAGAGVSADPINRRDGAGWQEPGVVINGSGLLDSTVGAGLLNVEQAFLMYLGSGVTKNPTETDPRIPAITAAGPYVGVPVPQGDDAGVDGLGGSGDPPIGLPGDRPSNGGIGNPGSFNPGVTGPIPGDFTGGNPNTPTDPAGEFSLRFFLSPIGLGANEDGDFYDPSEPELSDPNDFPAQQIEDAPANPRYPTLASYDADEPNTVQRLYIWAGYGGSRVAQIWDNVSLHVRATGDAKIAAYNIFNLTYQPTPQTTFTRWSVLSQGTPVPALPAASRINNIFMNATTGTASGLFRQANVVDRHYSAEADATLVGYIDVIGQGEIFLEVGANGINHRDELPSDSRVFFGPGGAGAFADDNNPIIFGSQISASSAFPEALLETIALLETPIPVRRVGWDHANLGVINIEEPETNYIDYFIEEPLEQGMLFRALLAWNRTVVIAADDFLDNNNPGSVPTLLQLEFENIDIELYSADPFGNIQDLLASTGSTMNNVKQLIYRPAPTDPVGFNMIMRVVYRGTPISQENANFANLEDLDLGGYELRFLRPGDVEYALSWATWSTDQPDLPPNVQPLLNSGYNLPEALLLPTSITSDASADGLVNSLSLMLNSFGAKRGDPLYRTMLDVNNDNKIDAEDLSLLLGAF